MKKIISFVQRKFKMLTLFDKLLIVSAFVCLLFFAYIFFRKSSYIVVTIKVAQDNVIYPSTGIQNWFSYVFNSGMQEKDGLGKIRAEVLEVYSYNTSATKKAVYIKTRLNVVYNRASNQYTFKGLPVLVGSTVRMYLDKVLVDGMVTHMDGVTDPRKKVNLLVKAQIREESPVFLESSGTRDYIANAVNVSDEIKDSTGKALIKIVDKTVQNAKKVVTTDDGRLLVQTDPFRKDVSLTAHVEAVEIHGKYFVFDDVPILVGSGLPIQTSLIEIWPEITEVSIL